MQRVICRPIALLVLSSFSAIQAGYGDEIAPWSADFLQDSTPTEIAIGEPVDAGVDTHRTADFVQFENCPQTGPGRPPNSIFVGASLFFARPHMKESFQANVVDVTTGTSQLIPLDYDHQISPRLWIGYQGQNDLGVRLSYWQFDHQANRFQQAASFTQFPSANATTVIFPANITTMAPGEILSVDNSLEVHTIDLEGTSQLHLTNLNLLATAGIRYASMQQTFDARASGVFPERTLKSVRDFEGAGLTIGLEAQKPLFSGFSFIGEAQGSLLYGEKKLVRSVVGDVTPNMPPPNVALGNAEEVSGIFDLALGLEWATEIADNREFILQGKYETSLWTAAGLPTLTFLGFEGFSLTTGLNW